MFSNIAYEALYQYIGLELHSRFIDVITSQRVFQSLILLIFGVLFFITMGRYFSRYIPGTLVQKRNVPLSKFVKVVIFLFLGISILKIGAETNIKSFNGRSWHENRYVKSQIQTVKRKYKVSFVFDILSRTAEGIGSFLGETVDTLMQKTNSQLEAPNFFYKAIMYAGTSTIDNQELKDSIDYYTDECFEKMLPLIQEKDYLSRLDGFFAYDTTIDSKLSEIVIKLPDDRIITCLEIKDEVVGGLKEYSRSKSNGFEHQFEGGIRPFRFSQQVWSNLQVSSLLTSHFLDKRESYLGIHKGSQVPGTAARIYQFFNRLLSYDGAISALGGKKFLGASLAAKRSQDFSENLSRAPHLAGILKMVLIFIFPFLIFAVVAGYWKVLLWWFFIYLSVVLWTPIWTLFYHIMTNISLSAEAMRIFGKLSGGISLYGAELITSRIYYMYSVFSWIQVFVGPLFTVLAVLWLRPMLSDTENESAPEFVDKGSKVATTGAKLAVGGA